MHRLTLAVVGLVTLVPLGLSAQQRGTPAPQAAGGKSNTAALCTAMTDYILKNPAAMQQMMQLASAPTKRDTIPMGTRQAIANAMTQRNFDSAAALTRSALPDGNDPLAAEAIGKVYRSMATVTDSAQLGELAKAMVVTAGADFSSAAFKMLAILPDTLRTMLISAAAASGNQGGGLECTMNSPNTPQAPTPAPAPKP